MKTNNKKRCSSFFSETIRNTMEEMGSEKTRPQVIAISAKRTIKNHPECKKYLDRPQQKVRLDDKHWIVWSSKSFRLHRSKPCSIRIFFSKKAPPSSIWRLNLKKVLQERLGVSVVRLGGEQEKDNYLEVVVSDPKLLMSILNHRVANFLD